MAGTAKHQDLGSAATSVIMAVAIGFACQGMGVSANRLLMPGAASASDSAVFWLLLVIAILGVDFLLYELKYSNRFSRAAVQLNCINAGLTVALAAIVADPGFRASRGSLSVIGGIAALQATLYFINWVVLTGPRLMPLVRWVKALSNGAVLAMSVWLVVLAYRHRQPEDALWLVVRWFRLVFGLYIVVGWVLLFRNDREPVGA